MDEFAESFATELFEAVPELRLHARAEKGILLIEHSPGRPRPDCEFWVTTAGGEVTVGFGMFHAHFEWPVTTAAVELDPISFIKSLMADEILIEDWTLDGKWSGSGVVRAGEEPDTEGIGPGHVLYIRSWSGARDQRITAK